MWADILTIILLIGIWAGIGFILYRLEEIRYVLRR